MALDKQISGDLAAALAQAAQLNLSASITVPQQKTESANKAAREDIIRYIVETADFAARSYPSLDFRPPAAKNIGKVIEVAGLLANDEKYKNLEAKTTEAGGGKLEMAENQRRQYVTEFAFKKGLKDNTDIGLVNKALTVSHQERDMTVSQLNRLLNPLGQQQVVDARGTKPSHNTPDLRPDSPEKTFS